MKREVLDVLSVDPCDVSNERLLYLPNELEPGVQVGPRALFALMLEQKELGAYTAVAIEAESALHGRGRAFQVLKSRAIEFQPTIILVQHPGGMGISKEVMRGLKALDSRPVLGYHEGDVHGILRKRLPASSATVARMADIVFTVGLGVPAHRLRAAGARRLAYTPSTVDTVRFGSPWEPTRERKFDVVMVASRAGSRIPLVRGGVPGAAKRTKLAQALGEALGPRLALYGYGWEGVPGWRGPLKFEDQERALREGWLTVNWGHFDKVPLYFSNRLPISLASGVAHLTSWFPQYERFFEDGRELYLARSVTGALRRAQQLLDGSREELLAVGGRGRQFALEKLTTPILFRRILSVLALIRGQAEWTGPTIR